VTTSPWLSFNRAELGGALGDLGVFVPLLVGMVTICGLQLGPALFCAGAMNVTTGLLFGIPMPVQPMKAIAAVAIGEGLTESQILTAGIATGAVIFLLAVTGLITRLSRIIPKSVLRGLQLGLGLKLVVQGVGMIAATKTLFGWDSIAVGGFCGLIVLLLHGSKRVPSALLVFGVGLIALLVSQPQLLTATKLGVAWGLPELSNPDHWRSGVLLGAIPQIPLTTLNSVVAVCALSMDLFPRRGAAPRRVAISVAFMNLICCPLGGMPMCHGSGGLASQYRFGARTGGSVVALGVVKMVLAVLFGGSLLMWLRDYPGSVLGILLMFGGLELAAVCRDQTGRNCFAVMAATAGVCLALNTAVGFVVGWVVAGLLSWRDLRAETV
jgi:hypothetical protein